MPLNIHTHLILNKAFDEANAGDRLSALASAKQYSMALASELLALSVLEKMIAIAPLINLFAQLGEWELLTLKAKDVCAYAEKFFPNTSETSGDFYSLSVGLEQQGLFSDAVNAMERSIEHLRNSSSWETYKGGSEKRLSYLKGLLVKFIDLR